MVYSRCVVSIRFQIVTGITYRYVTNINGLKKKMTRRTDFLSRYRWKTLVTVSKRCAIRLGASANGKQ